MPATPALRVSVTAPKNLPATDAVVVGVLHTPDGPRLAPGAEPVELDGRLAAALATLDAHGTPGEVLKIPTLGTTGVPLIVTTGLGSEPVSAEAARRAVGAAVRTLLERRRVHVALDAPVGALTEGALLGAYQFLDYKSAAAGRALRTITLASRQPATAARREVRRARSVADAVLLTRDLVNTPPNDLYPAAFADRVVALGGRGGVTVEVLDERALRRQGYGGVLAVGRGSARPPRLVRVSYRPARAGGHVALVGKGITFDTGGLNLKTANMAMMKSDMGGGAAVIAATLALAALRVPVAVTATVPMAENMPSGSSYRPSDVLTLRNGTTVEVADTDAEGRLILADAITRAAEDDPDRLIEVSTLTGAQLVALGDRVIGVMGEPQWRDEVVSAANDTGEAAWAMPLPDELRGRLDSPVADLVNLPADRFAGMLVAGRFLREFVPDHLPWAHLDIAGPAFNSGAARDYTPRGGTGAAVRTLVAAVERFAG